MTSISCCNVESCCFIPLWSRKKFFFYNHRLACCCLTSPRSYHSFHKIHKTPKCHFLICIHYHIDRCTKVWHALHITFEKKASCGQANSRYRTSSQTYPILFHKNYMSIICSIDVLYVHCSVTEHHIHLIVERLSDAAGDSLISRWRQHPVLVGV